MMNRLTEKDQVNVEMKNLFPNKVCVSPIMDFGQSYNNGIRIEDTVHSGRIEDNEEKVFAPTKKVFRSSSNAPNVWTNINVVPPNQYQGPSQYLKRHQTQYGGQPRQAPKLRRHFDPLGAPIAKIFDQMCKRGHLKPVDRTPYPNLLPKNWDTSLYFHFHQKTRHSTNECTWLKHEIQDLIDQNVII